MKKTSPSSAANASVRVARRLSLGTGAVLEIMSAFRGRDLADTSRSCHKQAQRYDAEESSQDSNGEARRRESSGALHRGLGRSGAMGGREFSNRDLCGYR